MNRAPSWFERLFGFDEREPAPASRFRVEPERPGRPELLLVSTANGAAFPVGTFNCPTLEELRRAGAAALRCAGLAPGAGEIAITHRAVSGALEEHARNPGATFQVASQFNCLEFPSPATTPEDGITQYEGDRTQGPDCALACAAATAYRAYCAPVPAAGGAPGQRAGAQLNNLDALETALVAAGCAAVPWVVANGYVAAGPGGAAALDAAAPLLWDRRNELLGAVRVGVHAGAGVTFASRWVPPPGDVRVTQVLCSAVSLGAYRAPSVPQAAWEPLARLVLDAAYEATLWAAVATAARPGGAATVFLTRVGGGVFGNDDGWIARAIGRAVATVEVAGARLTVVVCHHRRVDTVVRAEVDAAVASARRAAARNEAAGVAAGGGVTDLEASDGAQP